MSHSSAGKQQYEKLEMEDPDTRSINATNEILLNKTQSSDSSNDSSTISNRRVVKSCFWSTTIFSINFISSILVINLSKW